MHPTIHSSAQLAACVFLLSLSFATVTAAQEQGPHLRAVATYHYDRLRTGWDSHERTLRASAFPLNFGIEKVVTLDDQVDAQPLYVAHQRIHREFHDVVYVVTQGNTVYALDAETGVILLKRNLGQPVTTPLGCHNNGPNVGITSTPVIDVRTERLYVMAYVMDPGPTYRLFALGLDTLVDAVTPVTVTAGHTQTDGTTFVFDPSVQRQRPALLELEGIIYAGFGSFCDFSSSRSRGWILAWSAAELTPLQSNELTDSQASSATNFFLSSVWMSGYGLASNGSEIFAATGNSDCTPKKCPPQSTYDGITNIQESVIEFPPHLGPLEGIFTPTNVFELDKGDLDLGSGGVLLLPTQPNGGNYATALGKAGDLFLLNQSALGAVLDVHKLSSACWCGESYYTDGEGVGRVVSSAAELQTWRVITDGTPRLALESTTVVPQTAQDPGFFTVVSSDELSPGTAIIWAVIRPTSSTNPQLTLLAFDATPVHGELQQLYSGAAGPWRNLGGNANTVPLVANGRVYVAADGTLTIFGAHGGAARLPRSASAPAVTRASGFREFTGRLIALDGSNLTLVTRDGQSNEVDASMAIRNERSAELVVGRAYTLVTPRDRPDDGALQALAITRAKTSDAAWPDDYF